MAVTIVSGSAEDREDSAWSIGVDDLYSCPLVRWSIAIGINVHSGSGGNGGVGMLLVGMYFGRKLVLQE